MSDKYKQEPQVNVIIDGDPEVRHQLTLDIASYYRYPAITIKFQDKEGVIMEKVTAFAPFNIIGGETIYLGSLPTGSKILEIY